MFSFTSATSMNRGCSQANVAIGRQRACPLIVGLAAFLSACSSQPAAELVNWSMTKDGDGQGYRLHANAVLWNGAGGWFWPELRLRDARGCWTVHRANAIHALGSPNSRRVESRINDWVPFRGSIADVTLTFVYTAPDGGSFAETRLASENKVLDSSLRPPSVSPTNCSPPPQRRATREELRRRARTDPDGADAEAISNMSHNELTATAINSAGFLCARVTQIEARGHLIIANCIEYRNGTGRVRYRIDADTGTVDQLD